MTKAIIEKLLQLTESNATILVAIDGRCASGKTTLAAHLSEKLDCQVVHMDDFFLQPFQRSEKRLSQPGENIDHERILSEVLLPLSNGKTAVYRPFDCQSGGFGEPKNISPGGVILFEGSYSCHPSLQKFYHLKIFLTISADEQLKRLNLRNPERIEAFKSKWIPLEEKYFSRYNVESICDMVFKTDI